MQKGNRNYKFLPPGQAILQKRREICCERGKTGRKKADPMGGRRPQTAGDPLRPHGKSPLQRKSHSLLTDLCAGHIIL